MATPYTCICSKTNQHLVIAGSDQNHSLHLGRERKINLIFSHHSVVLAQLMTLLPPMSEDLGNSSSRFVKDATINALCKALERCVWCRKNLKRKPGQSCEIHEQKSDDDTSYWTLRLAIVFNRVKNNYFFLW